MAKFQDSTSHDASRSLGEHHPDVADRTIDMLQGAMAEARVADPRALATDIGPVIDAEAQAGIQRHIDTLRASGHAVHQPPVDAAATEHGTFIAPTMIEIDHLHQLQRPGSRRY